MNAFIRFIKEDDETVQYPRQKIDLEAAKKVLTESNVEFFELDERV